MRRFVIAVSKDWPALATIGLLVVMLITETGMALLLIFGLGMTGVAMWLYDNAPRWLRRSRFGRWLLRSRLGRRLRR